MTDAAARPEDALPSHLGTHADLAWRLGMALSLTLQHGERAAGELRAATRAYVAELKARGAPPEQVLVSVKDVGRRAAAACAGRFDAARLQSVFARLVDVAIDAYYEDV